MRPVLWTPEEVEQLRNGIVPEGRSEMSARTKAFKMNISFCPNGGKPIPKCDERTEKTVVDLYRECRNKSLVAAKTGISRNTVIDVLKRNGIEAGKSPHERLGEHVEYEGRNYSWKKGSWICTSSRVRASGEYNLAKTLWKKYHGVYPGPEYDVSYVDGNRYNLTKSNLRLLTKSEAQKLRMKDPVYRAKVTASCCMGLLMNAIYECLDPSKKAERIRKSVETRKRLHLDIQKKAWETRRRNAEERGYYFTDEQRKRMSEAHKGKPRPNKGKRPKRKDK